MLSYSKNKKRRRCVRGRRAQAGPGAAASPRIVGRADAGERGRTGGSFLPRRPAAASFPLNTLGQLPHAPSPSAPFLPSAPSSFLRLEREVGVRSETPPSSSSSNIIINQNMESWHTHTLTHKHTEAHTYTHTHTHPALYSIRWICGWYLARNFLLPSTNP
jgi:hypothetical protein